jgi:cellulose synthase/poly-beta-1,6-N-acetylglucosamine synthase-like glycosyltransferase
LTIFWYVNIISSNEFIKIKKFGRKGGANMDLSFISIPTIIIVNIYALIWIIFMLAYAMSRRWKNDSIDPSNNNLDELVSAIVPACNEEKVIEDIIRDLDSQTYRNLEIIVVVHNSRDSTYQRAKSVKTLHQRIIVELHTKEAGKGIALQHALKHARGSLIVIFDADNRVPPTFIENMVKQINRGYDCVQALILTKNPNYNKLTFCVALEYEVYPPAYSSIKNRLGLNAEIGGTGFMIKRTALDAVGGFQNTLIDDFDLALRLTLEGYKINYTESCYVYDEKPVTWKALIRQRSRWMAGYYELIRHYCTKPAILLKLLLKDPFKLLYLLVPISGPLAIVTFVALPLLYFFFGVTYFALPAFMWLILLIGWNIAVGAVLMRKGYTFKQAAKYALMLTMFSFHWYVVVIKALSVRSWAYTKTVHTGITTNPKQNL